MARSLENFIEGKIRNIDLDWFEEKIQEFVSLPYLSGDKNIVEFKGIVEEFNSRGDSTETPIDTTFDFQKYLNDSEECIYDLDSAMKLSNTGSLDQIHLEPLPGLNNTKSKIFKAISKIADTMQPSYDFKLFIDRTLALINEELIENLGFEDNEDYKILIEQFYQEIEDDILTKYKYVYEASKKSSAPNYNRFQIKINIEQLGAIALYLCYVSELKNQEKLNLLTHLVNVYKVWDKKKYTTINFDQLYRAFRKIQTKGHEGAGLKDIANNTNELIRAINSGKIKDLLNN